MLCAQRSSHRPCIRRRRLRRTPRRLAPSVDRHDLRRRSGRVVSWRTPERLDIADRVVPPALLRDHIDLATSSYRVDRLPVVERVVERPHDPCGVKTPRTPRDGRTKRTGAFDSVYSLIEHSTVARRSGYVRPTSPTPVSMRNRSSRCAAISTASSPRRGPQGELDGQWDAVDSAEQILATGPSARRPRSAAQPASNPRRSTNSCPPRSPGAPWCRSPVRGGERTDATTRSGRDLERFPTGGEDRPSRATLPSTDLSLARRLCVEDVLAVVRGQTGSSAP